MAKRKSTFEDIVEITAKLPWWVGVLLAVISYVLLHAYATSEVQTIDLRDGSGMAVTLFKSIANFGQYIFPAIFLIGALGSLIKRKKQDRLYTRASTNTPLQEISKMSWRDFEQFTAAAFRNHGYFTQDTNDGSDGGIDLVLKKDDEVYLVQCKHWRSNKVGVQVIRELLGVMASRGAAGGFVVTAGEYTKEAKAFAEGRNIELIDGAALDRWMIQPGGKVSNVEVTEVEETPSCPKCSGKMVKRVARKGPTAGKAFWGCSSYPNCRGTISIG